MTAPSYLSALRQAAERATPGPRHVNIDGMRGKFTVTMDHLHEARAADHDGVDGYTVSSANRDLLKMLSPARVLALVACAKALQRIADLPATKPEPDAHKMRAIAVAALRALSAVEG